MDELRRRIVGYAAVLAVALVATALGYQWGMATYEGRPQTFLDSLQFTVEMFTTTGFGGDAPWESPQMQAYIVVTDLLGMALLVGALPVVATPLFKSALSTRAPERIENDLTGHVVICSDTARSEVLIDELDSQSLPYVIVEPDRERADELHEAGHRVVRADPSSTDGLEAARIGTARALVADVSDRVDASIVLTAKGVEPDLPVVSVVDDPDRARYHRLAGADHALSPRSLVGENLAAKVTTAARTEIDEAVDVGDRMRLAEVSIRHGSDLAGTTLAESRIREESGASVIGVWIRGEFDPTPDPDTRLPAGTVVLVAGHDDQLERLVGMTQSVPREFRAGETVVVGFGHVGQAVAAELAASEIPYTVVDKTEGADVDVVGDATEPDALREAGVDEVDTVVLALPDDTTTEFAALVIRDLSPDTEIIARVEREANVPKTYRAGADYVLSLSTVTGRMIASRLFDDRDVLSLDQQVGLIRQRAPALTGTTLGEANVRERTGCTVIGVDRDGTVHTDVGPETAVEPDDELLVVGTDEGLRAFDQAFR